MKYEEIDYCEECRVLGDDYYIDEDGDLVMACYDCQMSRFGYSRYDDRD